jgi:TP53 regulating kinase-like protein
MPRYTLVQAPKPPPDSAAIGLDLQLFGHYQPAPPSIPTMASTTHILPPPFTTSTSSAQSQPILVTQGAEALVYKTTYLTPHTPCALKYRPKKSYRHPTLDVRLTKARILAEARVLVRCRREGVPVPAVLGADWEAGWLATEWIWGGTVRDALNAFLREIDGEKKGEGGEEKALEERQELVDLMGRIGMAVGRLHSIGVCHGDLTTSNLMLRQPATTPPSPSETETTSSIPQLTSPSPSLTTQPPTFNSLSGPVVIIDFGLASQTVQDEDRAVDLYVLERAFGSTHPQAEGLFKEVLRAYGTSFKGAANVLRRLEDVRMRGRKKSMIG